MPLLEKMGTLYGKNDDTPLYQEFHYKLIFTWFVKTRSLLLIWWLLNRHKKGWLRVSFIDQKVQLWNFNTITNIHKYRGFHEGHQFILMAMEVHNALGHDMDRFIKECVHLFHNRQSKGHLSLFFLHLIFQATC